MLKKTQKIITLCLILMFCTSLVMYVGDVNKSVSEESDETFDYIDESMIAAGDNWLMGWQYRKQITVIGQYGAGVDYPVRITVHDDFDDGLDGVGQICLYAHGDINFDDVRFTAEDGITLLPYWRESYTTYNDAIFWFKVAANLDENQIVYCYYGNPAATYGGSPHDVFLFYDDFGLYREAWTWTNFTTGSGSATSSIYNGKLHFDLAATSAGANWGYQLNSQKHWTETSFLVSGESYWTGLDDYRGFCGFISYAVVEENGKYSSWNYQLYGDYRFRTQCVLQSASIDINNPSDTGDSDGDYDILYKIENDGDYSLQVTGEYAETKTGTGITWDTPTHMQLTSTVVYTTTSPTAVDAYYDLIYARKWISGDEPITATPQPEEAWQRFWLEGFAYRQNVTIASELDITESYIAKYTVYYGIGISVLDSIYCNYECQADFDDIRFTTTNNTLIPYWIENVIVGEKANFWLRIPADENNGTQFNVYYGNSEVDDISSKSEVWDLLEDFDTWNTTTWNVVQAGYWQPTVTNGKLIPGGAVVDWPIVVYQAIIETYMNFSEYTYVYFGLDGYYFGDAYSPYFDYWGFYKNSSCYATTSKAQIAPTYFRAITCYGGSTENIFLDSYSYPNRISLLPTGTVFYEDNDYIRTNTAVIPQGDGYKIRFTSFSYNDELDYVYAYTFNPNQYEYGEIGVRETLKNGANIYDYTTMTYATEVSIMGMDKNGPLAIIPFNIFRTTGNSYEENVYIGTECKSDLSDIRFTLVDISTNIQIPLDYWIVDIYNGHFRTFVELKGFANESVVIIYFGNENATSCSDKNTLETVFLAEGFDYYDYIDYNIWDKTTYTNDGESAYPTLQYYNYYMKIDTKSSVAYGTSGYVFNTNNTYSKSFVYEARADITYTDYVRGGGDTAGFYIKDSDNHIQGLYPALRGDNYYTYYQYIDGSWTDLHPITDRTSDSVILTNKFNMTDGNYQMDIDSLSGTDKNVVGTISLTAPYRFGFSTTLAHWTSPVAGNTKWYYIIAYELNTLSYGCYSAVHLVGGSNTLPIAYGFDYRQKFTFNNLPNINIGDVFSLNIHYGYGSNYLSIYLNETCRSDYGDVRFFDKYGALIPFYIDDANPFSEGVVAYLIYTQALAETNELYMYWGNADIEREDKISDVTTVYNECNVLNDTMNYIYTAGVSQYTYSKYQLYDGGTIRLDYDTRVVPSQNHIVVLRADFQQSSDTANIVYGFANAENPYIWRIYRESDENGYTHIKTQTETGASPDATQHPMVYASIVWDHEDVDLTEYGTDYLVYDFIHSAYVPEDEQVLFFYAGDDDYLWLDNYFLLTLWSGFTSNNLIFGGVEELDVVEPTDVYVDVAYLYDEAALSWIDSHFPSGGILEACEFMTNSMNSFVSSMTAWGLYKPVFYTKTSSFDPDWLIYDEDGPSNGPYSTKRAWMDGWVVEHGWTEHAYSDDLYWKNRLDLTDPKNVNHNGWGYEYGYTPEQGQLWGVAHLTDPSISTNIYPMSQGVLSDADGIHGERMDILIMLTGDCDLMTSASVGGQTYTCANYLVVNLELCETKFWSYRDGLLDMFGHGGLLTILHHELCHVYGILGPEQLGTNYYEQSTMIMLMHYAFMFWWDLEQDIMGYWAQYYQHDLVYAQQKNFALFASLHSEYRPLLRYGQNYNQTETGFYILGNQWNFITVPC